MNLHVSRRTALKAFGAASLATTFVDRPEGAAARALALPEPQADPRHKNMTRPLDGIIIGGGNRGWLYAQYARTSPDAMRIVGICRVLRYAPYFIRTRDVVRGGDIGDVLGVQHLEPIGNVHQSHDLDLIHWMPGTPCRNVSSFGCLLGFRREHPPAGRPARFSAPRGTSWRRSGVHTA